MQFEELDIQHSSKAKMNSVFLNWKIIDFSLWENHATFPKHIFIAPLFSSHADTNSNNRSCSIIFGPTHIAKKSFLYIDKRKGKLAKQQSFLFDGSLFGSLETQILHQSALFGNFLLQKKRNKVRENLQKQCFKRFS